ncbi:MAG: S-layer homology domain-containing protein, partial [Firmicutes bacterium]|nr:S-layer homology domain-containing protein [Bacillota bacterium]
MKKVLSWVLVLALVLSSFTMAFAGDTANSSDMKDAAAIQNVEAVDVMVATGIIGGYPDGYYYPEKAVTRAEMAKMISVAVNGGEDVGAYYANSCTFADSVNHWAAGYIAYCANEGIIDGRDANTFDPDANVTGVEAAKMMLVALGYDSKIEGFTGGQWAGNLLKAAKAEELFDGCDDFNAGAVLDRDNAAQIIFNGLMAKGVKYDHQYEITTGDTSVTVNTKAEALTNKLYERAFGTDLKPGAADADGFGRPAHSWEYDKKDVGTYADEADITFVVETAGLTVTNTVLEDYDEDWGDDNVVNTVKYNGGVNPGLKEGDIIELYDTDTVDGAGKA